MAKKYFCLWFATITERRRQQGSKDRESGIGYWQHKNLNLFRGKQRLHSVCKPRDIQSEAGQRGL